MTLGLSVWIALINRVYEVLIASLLATTIRAGYNKVKTIGPPGDLDVSDGNEILTSMDFDELEALADSKLAPSSQARLDQLLAENSERQLSGDEAKELDGLLAKIDQLTILKTRARYTLKQQAEATQQ